MVLINLLKFMFDIGSIISIKSDISTLEGIDLSEVELLFSVDKESFENFKCNISEETLNHESLSRPPFGYNLPLGNFINTLCLFFQYSQIKHNDEFKTTLEELFYNFCGDISASCNSRLFFETYLIGQNLRIKKILEEKNILHQLVIVEEKDDRIICKYNKLYRKNFDQKFHYSLSIIEERVRIATMSFYFKFNEFYLQRLLEPGYFSSLDKLNEKYIKKLSQSNLLSSEQPYTNLFELYFRVDHSLRDKYEFSSDMSNEACANFSKEFLKNSFILFSNGHVSRYIKNDKPKAFNFLLGKIAANIILNISDNLDAYSSYPYLYVNSVFAIKKHIRKWFKENNLSEISVESLAIHCLELEI